MRALPLDARRTRVVLMSATFDTTIFTEYFLEGARRHSEELEWELRHGGGAALLGGAAAVLSIPVPAFLGGPAPHRLSQPPAASMMPPGGQVQQAAMWQQQPPAPQAAAAAAAARAKAAAALPPLAHAGSLVAALGRDTPTTLHVGAKRYPVEVVYLDDVFTHPLLRMMPQTERVQIASSLQLFERAVQAWARPRPGAPQMSVGDALVLPDNAKTALLTLAARVALAVARPGQGDCGCSARRAALAARARAHARAHERARAG